MVNLEEGVSTEGKILAAARQVFLQKGFAGARMQDIADAAGINKALLHYYFRSKEMLFEVIFRDAFDHLIPAVSEIFLSDRHFFEKIQGLVSAYVRMTIEHPFIPIFVLHQLHTNPAQFKRSFAPMTDRIPFPLLRAEIEKAVREGIIRPIEPMQLILNIISLCIFPSMARPMFQMVMQVSDAQYQQMLEDRKKSVADFIMQSIRI